MEFNFQGIFERWIIWSKTFFFCPHGFGIVLDRVGFPEISVTKKKLDQGSHWWV